MHILSSSGISQSRHPTPGIGAHAGRASWLARTSATVALIMLAAANAASAQGGGGQGQSPTAPAASANLKRTADRDDPINFLLEKKKLLVLNRALEDSLKFFRKEMQRYQEVVFKDLDKAATRKDRGQLPGPSIIASMTRDSEERVKDIQSAYRDRARQILSERQRTQVDSLEGIWKREAPKPEPGVRRPPGL